MNQIMNNNNNKLTKPVPSPAGLSPMDLLEGGKQRSQREFDEVIHLYLILVKNSARRRSQRQKNLPRALIVTGEICQICLHQAVGCFICQGLSCLHQRNYRCPILLVWPALLCRSLLIPPLGSSEVSLILYIPCSN